MLPDPRGSALHTLAWLRKPGADGAAGVGNTPHGPPVPTGNLTALELAKKLLEHGANPNVRINWEEKKFDKEGGTMKNPPLIQLGRHYLTYVGATPFYVAAHNGDAPYMRLLAEHGADPKMPNALGITPLIVAVRSRLLGRRGARPVHRRVAKRSGSRPSSWRSSWATTSTRTPISATTRWKAIPSTCCSTTR